MCERLRRGRTERRSAEGSEALAAEVARRRVAIRAVRLDVFPRPLWRKRARTALVPLHSRAVMRMHQRFLLTSGLLCALALGCDEERSSGSARGSSGSSGELPKEQASRVLAKVGDRTITLGDFATALERMDRIERLRYQTPERRQMLLEEMINVELLAREAERRGIDQQPETKAHIRLLQKEELMRRVRAELPAMEDLPASEVRAYYDANPSEFTDPERRRVAVIRVGRKALAESIIAESKTADAKRWGELAREHSTLPPTPGAAPPSKNTARPPLELEGDLGLVSAPGKQRGNNPRVPAPIRKAVFEIDKQGDVHAQPVSYKGAFYVVRLVGKSDARQRTFPEAEPNIRARLLQERLRKAEAELIERLQKTIPVSINEAALAKLAETPDTTVAAPKPEVAPEPGASAPAASEREVTPRASAPADPKPSTSSSAPAFGQPAPKPTAPAAPSPAASSPPATEGATP